jgi:hypothetical protein
MKKLSLDEFLSASSCLDTFNTYTEDVHVVSKFKLDSFLDKLNTASVIHINNKPYSYFKTAECNNLYFYYTSDETIVREYSILAESIIDIKETDSGITLFCYPNDTILVTLS